MKFRPPVLAAALILSLAACGPAPAPLDTPTPVVSAEPTTAPTPTATTPALNEPPLLEWMADQPVPEFLEEEQQALFLHAFSAANFLMGCSTSFINNYPDREGNVPYSDALSNRETVERNGWTYYVAVGRYAYWDNFKAMMDSLFTQGYQEELLNASIGNSDPVPRFFSDEDGRLCYLEFERGSDLEYGWCDTPDSYELVSRTENEILFDLVGHYVHLSSEVVDGKPVLLDEYTLSYPIRMEKTEAGWRFSEFHLPY